MLLGVPGFQPHLRIGFKLYIVFLFRIDSTVDKGVDNLWLLGLIHTVIICMDCGVHAAHNILSLKLIHDYLKSKFTLRIAYTNALGPRPLRATSHKTEGPWPLHFKRSHWWKRWRRFRFALHYAWGTNGVGECKMDVKVYMNSYMASNGSCFMTTWIIFKKPSPGVRPNTKLGDRDTPKPRNRWFVLFDDVWGPRVSGPVTYDFTLHLRAHDCTTWFWKCVGTAFGHFFWALTIFTVMALGLCLKWP